MEKGTALPKNIRQIGEIQGNEKVCIEDYVMTYIHKKEPQEEKGYLGVFLGERRETEEGTYVFIRGILEMSFEDCQKKATEQEKQKEKNIQNEKIRDQEENVQEAKNDVQDEHGKECEIAGGDGAKTEETPYSSREWFEKQKAEYFPGWEIQGCCVIGMYQPKQLEQLAEIAPEAGQMIYHLQEQEETLYWRDEEEYRRLRGYLVFYEQNRKMQEYMAEEFKDKSVEKESLPDQAIRSFREKIREKGEKRTGSMLRLASSFFVVTVLIVGAIAVNRIDDIRMGRNALKTDQEAVSGQIQQEGERFSAADSGADKGSAVTSGNVLGQPGTGVDTAGEILNVTDSIENTAAGMQGAADNVQNSATGMQGAADNVQNSAAGMQGMADNVTNQADSMQESPGVLQNSDAGQNSSGDGTAQSSDGTASLQESASLTGAAGGQDVPGAQSSEGAQDTSGGNVSDTNSSPVEGSASEPTGTQSGTADGTSASPAASETSARAIRASYVIRQGDTLADICSRYYGSMDRVEEICSVNHIADANMIMPGQKIVLP